MTDELKWTIRGIDPAAREAVEKIREAPGGNAVCRRRKNLGGAALICNISPSAASAATRQEKAIAVLEC